MVAGAGMGQAPDVVSSSPVTATQGSRQEGYRYVHFTVEETETHDSHKDAWFASGSQF